MYTSVQADFMIEVRVADLQRTAEKFANLSRDPNLSVELQIHFQGFAAHLYDCCRYHLGVVEADLAEGDNA